MKRLGLTAITALGLHSGNVDAGAISELSSEEIRDGQFLYPTDFQAYTDSDVAELEASSFIVNDHMAYAPLLVHGITATRDRLDEVYLSLDHPLMFGHSKYCLIVDDFERRDGNTFFVSSDQDLFSGECPDVGFPQLKVTEKGEVNILQIVNGLKEKFEKSSDDSVLMQMDLASKTLPQLEFLVEKLGKELSKENQVNSSYYYDAFAEVEEFFKYYRVCVDEIVSGLSNDNYLQFQFTSELAPRIEEIDSYMGEIRINMLRNNQNYKGEIDDSGYPIGAGWIKYNDGNWYEIRFSDEFGQYINLDGKFYFVKWSGGRLSFQKADEFVQFSLSSREARDAIPVTAVESPTVKYKIPEYWALRGEIDRLSDEMRLHFEAGRLEEVEVLYREIMDMETDLITMGYGGHFIASKNAFERGDLLEAYYRARIAYGFASPELGEAEEAFALVHEYEEKYAYLDVKASSVDALNFPEDDRREQRAINFLHQEIDIFGEFKGLVSADGVVYMFDGERVALETGKYKFRRKKLKRLDGYFSDDFVDPYALSQKEAQQIMARKDSYPSVLEDQAASCVDEKRVRKFEKNIHESGDYHDLRKEYSKLRRKKKTEELNRLRSELVEKSQSDDSEGVHELIFRMEVLQDLGMKLELDDYLYFLHIGLRSDMNYDLYRYIQEANRRIANGEKSKDGLSLPDLSDVNNQYTYVDICVDDEIEKKELHLETLPGVDFVSREQRHLFYGGVERMLVTHGEYHGVFPSSVLFRVVGDGLEESQVYIAKQGEENVFYYLPQLGYLVGEYN